MDGKTYLLRGIPEPLWRAVKAQSAQRGMTIRDTILALLAQWAKKGAA